MMRFVRWNLLALACALACSDNARVEPTSSACDPFAVSAEPIVLGTVLGAGRDSGGTIYVIDQAPEGAELRAFAGSETTLVQQPVGGSGSSSEGSGLRRDSLTIDVLPRSYVLILEREGDETRMGRTFDVESRGIGAIADLSPNDQLEIIDPALVEGAEIRRGQGGDGAAEIEYFAHAASGELFLVVKPPDSEGYEDFRLFYGPEDALRERELISVTRARDGGSTHLVFEFDGQEADAFFPVDIQSGQVLPGELSVDGGGDAVSLERFVDAADAERLEGARFECRG